MNNDNEILKERINKAEKEMEKAQEKLERAEEAFTQWKQANGIQPDNPVYQELKQEVERNFAAVESCRRTYDKLLETYDDLVKKMPDVNSATLENLQDNIIKSMKRILDDAE
jgi:tetratricopeptide (TPR) repeat protein